MKVSLATVLVLSPHTDDGELAAGGTIARMLEEGKEVHYVAFSGCEDSVPDEMPKDTLRKECLRSTSAVGLKPDRVRVLCYKVRTFPEHRQEILDEMIKIRKEVQPDLVLVPSSHDMHQDHGTIYWEALRAFKRDASMWGYEHPWNNLTFTTDIFVRLAAAHIEKKLKALQQYRSQSRRGYMKEDNIRCLVATRGSQLDVEYAEAFELIRLIL
jgi:N-acetylglucosamine malate deacetylase 1